MLMVRPASDAGPNTHRVQNAGLRICRREDGVHERVGGWKRARVAWDEQQSGLILVCAPPSLESSPSLCSGFGCGFTPATETVKRNLSGPHPSDSDSDNSKSSASSVPTSGKVVAIEIHDLVPRSGEVLHKSLLGVVARVDFCERPQLGVRTEDEIDAGSGPLEFVRRPVASFIYAFRCGRGLPFRIHVKQVDEEIIGQRFRAVRKNAVPGLAKVRIQSAHAANQYGHLRGCQG